MFLSVKRATIKINQRLLEMEIVPSIYHRMIINMYMKI
jgi:hypothetical protein